MRRGSIWLLAAVGLIGALVITLGATFLAIRAADSARAAATDELRLQADAGAHEANRFLRERIETLQALAQAPALHSGRDDSTQLILDSLPGVSGFATAGVVDQNGDLVARSGGLPTGPKLSYADRDFVQEVLRTRQPSVGTAVIGRIGGEPVIPIAVPLEDTSGHENGLLSAGVVLTNDDTLRFGVAQSLTILGRAGQVVYDSDSRLRPLEERAEWLDAHGIRTRPNGVFTGDGVHGSNATVVAFSAVALPAGQWTVVVEQPADALFAAANNRLKEELLAVLIFFTTTIGGLALVTWRLTQHADAERAAQAAAAAAMQSRDAVVGQVLHDLRSPLTVITGFAALQRRRSEAANAPFTEEIQQAAARMEGMLRQIGFAQGATVELRPAAVKLRPFLEGILEAQRVIDQLHEFRLDFNGPDELEGQWDRDLITRVLENLLSNARKFSAPESTITLSGSIEGAYAVVAVSDQGQGIPEDERREIFEPFRRGRNASSIPGLGIGLSSAANIVRQHGGEIALTSMVDSGTTVTIRLPLTVQAVLFGEGADEQVAT
jgi:signal transduction histidine kinase